MSKVNYNFVEVYQFTNGGKIEFNILRCHHDENFHLYESTFVSG